MPAPPRWQRRWPSSSGSLAMAIGITLVVLIVLAGLFDGRERTVNDLADRPTTYPAPRGAVIALAVADAWCSAPAAASATQPEPPPIAARPAGLCARSRPAEAPADGTDVRGHELRSAGATARSRTSGSSTACCVTRDDCAVCHEDDTGGHVFPMKRAGSETCTFCHDNVIGNRLHQHGATGVTCLACHDPHASDAHVAAPGRVDGRPVPELPSARVARRSARAVRDRRSASPVTIRTSRTSPASCAAASAPSTATSATRTSTTRWSTRSACTRRPPRTAGSATSRTAPTTRSCCASRSIRRASPATPTSRS